MEHTLQTHVVNQFRNLLNVNNLTQNEIAERMELTRQTVSNYFTGRTELTLSLFERFCDVLAVSVLDVIETYTGGGGQRLTVTGRRNVTSQAGRDVGGSEVLKTENDYLKQLVKEKEQRIILLERMLNI